MIDHPHTNFGRISPPSQKFPFQKNRDFYLFVLIAPCSCTYTFFEMRVGFRGVARVRGSESDPYEEESDFFPALN